MGLVAPQDVESSQTGDQTHVRCTGRQILFLAALGLSSLQHEKSLSCGMRDLAPQPGIKPRAPALGTRSLSHWTAREVQSYSI